VVQIEGHHNANALPTRFQLQHDAIRVEELTEERIRIERLVDAIDRLHLVVV
jgi:hypothetical protein